MAKRSPMTVTAFTARTQFGQVLDRVSKNRERFFVTKNGEAKAVILGLEDFYALLGETPDDMAELGRQAQKSGADRLKLEEIDAEIAAYRREREQLKAKR